ncbi:hypothetical protein AB1Y20_006740 [Prymnesium parvum]|uniref:J domain-containing protein n=1 Tax=Prymnesium parvum TaxID=97485 RepID=A0AB34IYL8_PRYPA
MALSLEALRRLQAESCADDVAIDLETMRLWSEDKARRYFENGGSLEPPLGKQGILDILEGRATEAPPDCEGPVRPEDAAEPSRAAGLPDIRKTLGSTSDGDEEKRPKHELPAPASEIMTVDEAYEFLGISMDDRGDLEKLKRRFRKLSLLYHPDKNPGREEAASRAFQGVHAAYHFLTTMNFDYKRWKQSFSVPPLQSLEEVLLMALAGEDPYKIELLMRRRGEYRPHEDFGINLSIPWNAGSQEEASWEVANGSAYTSTQGIAHHEPVRELSWQAQLGASADNASWSGTKRVTSSEAERAQELAVVEDARRAQVMTNELAVVEAPRVRELGLYQEHTINYLSHYGEQAELGNNVTDRPWEAVALGKELPKKEWYRPYAPPKLREDLKAGDPDADQVAETYNSRALKAFKKKEWQLCYDLASEAIRLKPDKVAYLGNRAAACLKLSGLRHLREACADCQLATQIDPSYAKGYARAAEANFQMGERHTIRKAMELYETALKLDSENQAYKNKYNQVCLEWEAMNP